MTYFEKIKVVVICPEKLRVVKISGGQKGAMIIRYKKVTY